MPIIRRSARYYVIKYI